MREVIAEFLVIAGIACVTTGAAIIHPAAGFLTFGALCLIVGVGILKIKPEKKDNKP